MLILTNARRFLSQPIHAVWVVGLFVFMTACVAVGPTQKSVEEDLQETWGIEVTQLHLSAAGHMVDFRYRVLDAQKAETLFVRANKPYLIDQKSEKLLSVPSMGKIGPLRTSNMPQEDRIYWMFFGNHGGLVQSGDKVTVVIGDFRAENLVVQ